MWYHQSDMSYSHMASSGSEHKGTTVTLKSYQICSFRLYLFLHQIVSLRIFLSFGNIVGLKERLSVYVYQLISYLVCPSHCVSTCKHASFKQIQ